MKIHSSVKNSVWVLIMAMGLLVCSCTGTNDIDLNDGEFIVGVDTSVTATRNGFTYEFWNQDETGDAVMRLRSDGSFDVSWTGIFNMLARNGVRPGENVTSVTYSVEDYQASTASYLCVYGWFYNGDYEDLVEYYIVENWRNYNPKGNATYYGSVTVGDDTYNLFTSERVQQPSIDGTRTFTQYWSIRQDDALRTSGTIDVPAHFQAWEDADLLIGEIMHEVSFCIEGFGGKAGGTGYANVTELSFNTR